MGSMAKMMRMMATSDRTEILSDTAGELRTHPVMKPKPAGTLLILDERDGRPHVLMGLRHSAHKFMPGVFVFPGGRVDPPDNHAPFNNDLTGPTLKRVMSSGWTSLATERRARAFALAAIRETFEEAGIFIGQPSSMHVSTTSKTWIPFLKHGQLPDLQQLRYLARAVTPPGLIRRYDTRFFTVPREAISLELEKPPTDELSDLSWVPLDQTETYKLHRITKLVLNDVSRRVAEEGSIHLRDDHPVPVYTMRRGKHCRKLV